MFVPVVNQNRLPVMPTIPSRAKRWIASRKATGFFNKGVFCVRLNQQPSDTKTQKIAVGIDPGSKREAFTVKSASHTYCNILTESIDWVKGAVKNKRNARRARRNRKTPCRGNRLNRCRGGIPPSTKARWQWKLRMARWLVKIFPVTHFVVEDVAAKTKKGANRWNTSFSPLEVGKKWFYYSLCDLAPVTALKGWRTFNLRKRLGLQKSQKKLADRFECHNVDSWVLANWKTRGHRKPDNRELIKIIPLQYHRRQLHLFQPSTGNIRRDYGGTRSLGFTRGSLVKHKKYGVTYVGGTSDNRISLHDINSGKRLTQNAKQEDCKFLRYNSWRTLTQDGNSSPR